MLFQGAYREQYNMDSFSYRMEPKSGYTLSSMDITYKGINLEYGEDVEKTITVNQLVMTNYPTTSLGWVFTELPAMHLGVSYKPIFNGVTYREILHTLIAT